MRLTKLQRVTLFKMFGGRCAYCGDTLGAKWCADHVAPVIRETTYIKGKGFVATGKVLKPENDSFDNLFPSCTPCNINKGALTLDSWRHELGKLPDILNRNYPAYRMAKRVGVVAETGIKIQFFFEIIAGGGDE